MRPDDVTQKETVFVVLLQSRVRSCLSGAFSSNFSFNIQTAIFSFIVPPDAEIFDLPELLKKTETSGK